MGIGSLVGEDGTAPAVLNSRVVMHRATFDVSVMDGICAVVVSRRSAIEQCTAQTMEVGAALHTGDDFIAVELATVQSQSLLGIHCTARHGLVVVECARYKVTFCPRDREDGTAVAAFNFAAGGA